MTREQFEKEKEKLILKTQTELTRHSTYQTQKAGVSADMYTRLRLRPKTMRIETIFNILEKLEGIKEDYKVS